MSTRKFTNLLCYIALGAIAAVILIRFLGTRLFNFGGGFTSVLSQIAYYCGILATMLSAYAFAKSRRNNIYIWLFVLFVAIIVVFSFVL